MKTFLRSFWPPLLLSSAALLLAVLAPEEKTLGDGIRVVYVHVALTWTGMLLLGGTALLGLAVVAVPRPAWAAFQRRLYGVALAFFALGYGMSMLASLVNWGGVPIREPRFITSMNVLVIGVIAWFLADLFENPRLAGLLRAAPVLFLVWSVQTSTVVLHPASAVNTAPPGIRYTFLGMFAIMLALAAWGLWPGARRAES
ncbi:MAG: hypothetical protein EPO32_03675 [Anaerolineae bacterium]|nr:MAG: hypothetical protein EPO32_03675 [Anaerolineae bacterium]